MTRKRNVNKITKFKRSVKAISPVIATLLMIAIAVVASLVAYAWVMGYMGTTTTKVGHQIQIPSYTYDVSTGSSLLTVYVQNTGQGAVQLKQDGAVFANDVLVPILKADGVDVTIPAGQLITVTVGQTVSLLVNYTYSQGEYVKIKIVTVDGTSMQTSGTPNQGGQGDSTQNEFTTQNEYALTVTAVGGSVAKSPDQVSYHSGDKVYLTATADLGWSFSAWSPNVLSDAGGSYVAFGAADLGVTATFTQDQYTLTVNVVGDGCSVTKNPDQVSYTYGTSVALTPVAASGWTFSGWSGDSTTGTVSMTGSKTVTASFTQNEYALTVTAVGGSVAKSPDQVSYHSGDKVYLTETPDSGNSFSGWSANVLSDAGGSYVLFGAGDVAVTASFTQNSYAVSLIKVGSGTASMSGSSPYVYGAGVTLSASESVSGWTFAGWTTDNPSGIVITNGGLLSASAVITGSGTITATFSQNSFTVSVGVAPPAAGSAGCTVTGSGSYHYGDKAYVTASVVNGWSFSSWSLAGVQQDGNGFYYVVTGPLTVTASFTQNEYSVEGLVSPTGAGSVTFNNTGPYHYNDAVTLTPNANLGYTFSGWSGDGVSGTGNTRVVTVTGNMKSTALFILNVYTIDANVSPTGAGSVTFNNTGPYHYNDVVNLTWHVNPGYTFSAWSVDGVNSGNDRIVTVTGNMHVTATFTQNEYSIDVTVLPSSAAGTVTSNASAQIRYGDVVNFTWHASPGYTFSAWSVDGVNSGNDRIVTVTGNMHVTATFAQTQYKLTITVVGSGSVIKSPDASLYNPGQVVQLVAVPADGNRLNMWSGDLSGLSNFASLTMNGDKTITATFVPVSGQYQTSIDWWYHSDQVQQGADFSGLGFLNPGLSNRPVVLTFTAPDGSKIVDTSTVTISGIFQGFFWAQISIPQNAMAGTWSVTAQFLGDSTYGASTADPITFQVSPLPTYTVHFDATGVPLQSTAPIVTFHIDGGSDQQGIVPFDVQVAQNGKIYYSYQNIVSQGATTQYVLTNGNPNPNPSSPQTITGPLTVTGSYTTQYKVTFAVSPSGSGGTSPSGTNVFENAGSLSLLATPNTGYVFDHWSSTGSITFNNPNAASTFATIGGTGTITAYFVPVVTETVTITPANGFSSSDSVTISGAGASVTSIKMDGQPHTFTANPNSAITFTVPADGSTRYRFNNAGSASTTWSYTTTPSGTDTKPNTLYYQYQVTPYYTRSDSSSPTVTNVVSYRQLGSSLTATPTQGTTGGSWVWVDANTAVMYNSPIPASPTTERWQVSSADTGTYTAIASVSGSGSATVNYYHQFKEMFQYSITNTPAGSPSSGPIVTYNQFGSSKNTVTAVLAPATTSSDWVDASSSGTAITYANPLAVSTTTERWQASSTPQYAASSSATLNPSYKHQFLLTVKTSGLTSSYKTNVYIGGSATTDDYGFSTIKDSDTNGWRKWFDAGSYTGTIMVDNKPGGGSNHSFNQWSDGQSNRTHPTIQLNAAQTLTAQYQ